MNRDLLTQSITLRKVYQKEGDLSILFNQLDDILKDLLKGVA